MSFFSYLIIELGRRQNATRYVLKMHFYVFYVIR